MILSKIFSGATKIFLGDILTCVKLYRQRSEPYTNLYRIAALLSGGITGSLFLVYVSPSVIHYFIQLTQIDFTPLVATSIDVTDASLGMIFTSRIFDFMARLAIGGYYFCKYGNTQERYKTLSNVEVVRIHDELSKEHGSKIKSREEIWTNLVAEGFTEEHCNETLESILEGTLCLINKTRDHLLEYKKHVNTDQASQIDIDWLLLRKGLIRNLCLLENSYVKNILKQQFDLPTLNGRQPHGVLALSIKPSITSIYSKDIGVDFEKIQDKKKSPPIDLSLEKKEYSTPKCKAKGIDISRLRQSTTFLSLNPKCNGASKLTVTQPANLPDETPPVNLVLKP
jgi:hypothetical protein